MNQKILYLDLNRAFNSLFRELSRIDDDAYNQPRFGHWTTGQLADHLTLSAGGFLRLVQGPVEKRALPVDGKVELIKHFMLDFNQKYSSPEFIIPGQGPFDRSAQREVMNTLHNGWLEAVRELDPEPTCLLFPLPGVDFLTRQEAGFFLLYHLQRHLHQMSVL